MRIVDSMGDGVKAGVLVALRRSDRFINHPQMAGLDMLEVTGSASSAAMGVKPWWPPLGV
jgi:hypothetical protein